MIQQNAALTPDVSKELTPDVSKAYIKIERKVINLMLNHPEAIKTLRDKNINPDYFSEHHQLLVKHIYYYYAESGDTALLTENTYRKMLIDLGIKGDITIAMQEHHECTFGVHHSNSIHDLPMLTKTLREAYIHRENIYAQDQYNQDVKTKDYIEASKEYISRLTKITESVSCNSLHMLDMVTMDQVIEKPIQWLWQDRIPIGKFTTIFGDGGTSKSLLTQVMAANITSATPFQDDPSSNKEAGNVLFISCEDDRDDTLAPRLRIHGADQSRITHIRCFKDDSNFNLKKDIGLMRAALKIKPYKLVVIDPVTAFMGDVNIYVDNEVRRVLNPIVNLAEDFNVAIIAIIHVNKGKHSKAGDKMLASVAFKNLSRMVWTVIEDKDDPDLKLFLPVKQNICKAAKNGLSYRIIEVIEQEPGDEFPMKIPLLVWEDGHADVTANEAYSTDTPMGEAIHWLNDILANDVVVASKDIQKQAIEEGISLSTLRRAKAKLKIKAEQYRIDGKSVWKWRLQNQKSLATKLSLEPLTKKEA